MRWVTNKSQNDYMRMRQAQNSARMTAAERWAFEQLKRTPLKWTFQAMWGCRLFDFWCSQKGCAIEIDGPEHDRAYDAYRDRYNYIRSYIKVFRVPNFNQPALDAAICSAIQLEEWKARQILTKQERKFFLKATIGLAHGNWRPSPDATG